MLNTSLSPHVEILIALACVSYYSKTYADGYSSRFITKCMTHVTPTPIESKRTDDCLLEICNIEAQILLFADLSRVKLLTFLDANIDTIVRESFLLPLSKTTQEGFLVSRIRASLPQVMFNLHRILAKNRDKNNKNLVLSSTTTKTTTTNLFIEAPVVVVGAIVLCLWKGLDNRDLFVMAKQLTPHHWRDTISTCVNFNKIGRNRVFQHTIFE